MVRTVIYLGILSAGALFGARLDPPSSGAICGRCHRAIYEAWKSSAHAQAMEDSFFQDALALAEEEFGPGARKTCLGCHAPVAALTGDLDLRYQTSWEGVTCDYCHSVRGVPASDGRARPVVEFSDLKSGPVKYSPSTAHQTAYSEVHLSSQACVACHEFRNALGFALLTTFTEWSNSRAGKEKQPCQGCHMYAVKGDVVDPRIRRSTGATVNLHQMPGGHTLDQLTRTIKADLRTRREGASLKAAVDVMNRNAGHYVPTGSPLRRLVLELKVDSYDGQHFRAERVYRRTVADQAGHVLESEHTAFFKAAKVLSDTRLAPDEKRTEEFEFAVPAGVAAQVTATFWYLYSPDPRTGQQEKVTFLNIGRLVR